MTNEIKEKAKMIDEYCEKYYIPKEKWRDVHFMFDNHERDAKDFRDYLDMLDQKTTENKPNYELMYHQLVETINDKLKTIGHDLGLTINNPFMYIEKKGAINALLDILNHARNL